MREVPFLFVSAIRTYKVKKKRQKRNNHDHDHSLLDFLTCKPRRKERKQLVPYFASIQVKLIIFQAMVLKACSESLFGTSSRELPKVR